MNKPPVNGTSRSHPLHPHALNDRERAARAVAMRIAGHTLREIVGALGYYDETAASRAIRRSMDRVESDTVDQYRALLTARYEDLYRRAVDDLDAGSHGREVGRAALVSAARSVLDSLAKVHGLTAAPTPARAEVTIRVRDELDDELHRLASLIRSHAPAAADTAVLDAIIDETAHLPASDAPSEVAP